MKKWDHSYAVEGNVGIWRYGVSCALVMTGTTEMSLLDASVNFEFDEEEMVENEKGNSARERYAGINREPSVSVEIGSEEAGVLIGVRGLDQRLLQSHLTQLADDSWFTADSKPSDPLLSTYRGEFLDRFHVSAYNASMSLSRKSEVPFETAYQASQYNVFLHLAKGISKEEALARSLQHFGVSVVGDG